MLQEVGKWYEENGEFEGSWICVALFENGCMCSISVGFRLVVVFFRIKSKLHTSI